MSKDNTALATQQPGFLYLAEGGFSKLISAELEGLDLTFERIKIPSGGATVFELPGEGDETEMVKEFSAVVLFHQTVNALYKTKYTGGSNPPDCGSVDGITGEGDPGGRCKVCPHNKFGSGENGAKACKNRRRLYLLREGELFPMILIVLIATVLVSCLKDGGPSCAPYSLTQDRHIIDSFISEKSYGASMSLPYWRLS